MASLGLLGASVFIFTIQNKAHFCVGCNSTIVKVLIEGLKQETRPVMSVKISLNINKSRYQRNFLVFWSLKISILGFSVNSFLITVTNCWLRLSKKESNTYFQEIWIGKSRTASTNGKFWLVWPNQGSNAKTGLLRVESFYTKHLAVEEVFMERIRALVLEKREFESRRNSKY